MPSIRSKSTSTERLPTWTQSTRGGSSPSQCAPWRRSPAARPPAQPMTYPTHALNLPPWSSNRPGPPCRSPPTTPTCRPSTASLRTLSTGSRRRSESSAFSPESVAVGCQEPGRESPRSSPIPCTTPTCEQYRRAGRRGTIGLRAPRVKKEGRRAYGPSPSRGTACLVFPLPRVLPLLVLFKAFADSLRAIIPLFHSSRLPLPPLAVCNAALTSVRAMSATPTARLI